MDLLDVDLFGEPQDVELVRRDLARAADRDAGPGERMAADEGLGRPSSRPSTRTSSLNSSRSGSTSFTRMRSGRPPTLWCDLIVTDGPPVNDTLSITSG